MKSRTIILASASPQRQRLLKYLGLPFRIRKSSIKEHSIVKTTCAALVKENALLKAKNVARHNDNALVIGADTLVFLGKKKIIGKPRTLKEAKRNLYILSHNPQWIYTGLAVIDTKTKKTICDYEKTKVYMRPLSKKEIDRYYQMMLPMDKAGGFDIEGKGSLFIDKIHGCYFNVVGLPVAKLCRMLKKMGVALLSLFLMVNVLGCASEYNLATQREERLMYGTDKEISIGENIARQFNKKFKIDDNPVLNKRVTDIGRRIEEVCDRKDLVFIFRIIDENKVNAVSLPGGFVYVFKGLIDKVDNDDELASVIAHEVGHVAARHSIKRMQALFGYTFLKVLAIQAGGSKAAQGVDAAFSTAFMEYSLQDEFEADRLSIKYLKKAGFDPNAMVGFLKKMKAMQEKEETRPFSYWRTHPYLSQRISAANQTAEGRLQFKDYLNVMDKK